MQTRFQTALAFEKNNSKRVRYFNAALNSKVKSKKLVSDSSFGEAQHS